MSESSINTAQLCKAATAQAIVAVALADTATRETLMQFREGLLLQLRAIERILWPTGTKSLEAQERKR